MTDAKEQANKDREIAKGLVGKTVILSPTVPFFFEDNSQYVLNAEPVVDGKESEFKNSTIKIKDGWKLECTLRNVRAGILRVLDEKGSDVSEQFGGPALPPSRKSRPMVTTGMAQYNKDDQRDVKLRKILDNINEKEIVQVIEGNKLPYELLERLLQLELSGENPAYRSRATVVDGIKEIIKRTPGIGAVREEKSDEKITASRR